MRLSFDTIDEVKDFVKQLKGTRGGKGGDADEGAQTGGNTTGQVAPAPLAPPAGGAGGFPGAAGFAPPTGAAFPGPGTVGPSAEVLGLVQRISGKIDWAITAAPNGGGQPVENVLSWFRNQCGPEAANYTMDQIKQNALPRQSLPTLENIAKMMNA